MIGIIDCGMGNIASIKNMLKKAGADSCILSEAKEVENADKLILPGVGSFDVGIGRIRDGGFDQAIFRHVEKGKPLLGICLGMQLLGCAYLVEWCDREEMVRRSCQVGEIIQRTFQSWDELCQSFLDGFAAWRLSGSADESDMASVQQRADIYWAIKGRKDSPYNLPWGMELKPAKK